MNQTKAARDNNFDLLRVLLAVLVIFSHAFEMFGDSHVADPLCKFTHTTTSLGDVALTGFFVLSGFLILKSWLATPQLKPYFRKRLLRIVPGYLVAALLSTVVVGLAATRGLQYFHHLGMRYPLSILLLDRPDSRGVFPGHPMWDGVNGSLWSIKYEFRCYIWIALAGVCGLFGRNRLRCRWPMVALTLACMTAAYVPAVQRHVTWNHWRFVLGDPRLVFGLTSAFLCGGCFYLFWDEIHGSAFARRWLPWLAFAAMLPLLFHAMAEGPALTIFGGYALLSLGFARIPALDFYKRAPDLSYGIYLYGWPVESLWTWYLHTPPLLTFAATVAIVVPLAWLSWHWVERPALLLKPKGSVPVPDAG